MNALMGERVVSRKNRYPALWDYEFPGRLLSALDEYHILKVPLLGQHYPKGPGDWCGRTASAMAYNYYQVVQGGDFTSRFVTHWDGGKPGQFVDLRYPGGQRAFHTKPTAPPFNANLGGYSVSNRSPVPVPISSVSPPQFGMEDKHAFEAGDYSASKVLGFAYGHVLPCSLDDRRRKAARIANDPNLIEGELSLILQALAANNPVIFYSGFSANKTEPIHLVLIVGFAWLVDASGRHLWLVVADPATQNNKIGDKKGSGLFFPPESGSRDGTDLNAIAKKQVTGEHDLIRVRRGDWENAQAPVVLIRARKLFEENTYSAVPDDLFMDYRHDEHKGGAFLYSLRPTVVPSGFLETNVMRTVAYPFDHGDTRFRPINCYALTETEMPPGGLFPLGMRRNLHSGIHLPASHFSAREGTANSAAGSGVREVRCFAPGYVVAVRLAHGLPAPLEEKERVEEGPEAHELAREFTGNHNSFVLVRHDVEEAAKTEGQPPRRFTFYSLYMHLVPPDWKDPDTYRNVDWLKLLVRRHGAVTVIDPAHEAFRQTRWLQEALPEAGADVFEKKGGSYSVVGTGLGVPETLRLGEAPGDDVRALWRPADQDLTGIHEALREGRMVTLRHPLLKLEAGAVLGYVDSRSKAIGDGFVHWEILAPSEPGQLKDFLDFAKDTLGLGDFFKVFEEADQNNFFDPSKGELDALMRLAPKSIHAAGNPEEECLSRFEQTYHHGALKEILRSPRALAFSSDDAPGDAGEPSFPAELVITNYKDALPEGTYWLKLTFEPPLGERYVAYDGKQSRLNVRLPAGARRIFVEPADRSGFLLQVGGGAQDALEQELQHFKRLASVRWRNVVLRHLNEWLPESIVVQVMKHLEIHGQLRMGSQIADIQQPDEAKRLLGRYAEAVGFWAHPEEVPFLGPVGDNGGKKALFAAAPDVDQLPAKGLVDNPHPVTFAWLLMLMVRHGLVRFSDLPAWRPSNSKDVLAVGWLPARSAHVAYRVGELLDVGAVVRGSGDDEVELQMLHEGTRCFLASGSCTEGAFFAQVELPGWGACTLDMPGARLVGTATLEVLPPVLLGGRESAEVPGSQVVSSARYAPESHKDGTFSWRIPFRENCPKLLRGWVLLSAWAKATKQEGLHPEAPAFELARVAIPVQGREDSAFNESSGLRVVDGFIQKGALKKLETYVTRHFTYRAFLKAAASKAEPPLAWALVEAVERVQCAYSEKQLLVLSALAEDGLSIVLTATNARRLKDAAEKVREDGWFTALEDAAKGAIRVRVPAPAEGHHPGELVIRFDASAAFSELRKGIPGTHEVHVKFGAFFPNGGSAWDSRLATADTLGSRWEPVTLDALRSGAKAGALEVWSTEVSEVLHIPSLEAPKVFVTARGIQLSSRLLGGNRTFWEKARPIIKVGHSSLDEAAARQSVIQNGCVVRTFGFEDAQVQERILIPTAEVVNKHVPLGHERIDVQPAKGRAYTMQRNARLEARSHYHDAFSLKVAVMTEAVPVSRPFRLELASPSLPGGPPGLPLKLKKGSVVYKPERQGQGLTDVEGALHADVDLNDVEAALEGAREYVLRVVPIHQNDADLARELKLSLPERIVPRVHDDVRIRPNLWWWSDDLGAVPMKGEG
ncbi:hypothetical protein MVI01_50880 [Myxococcus virescens]|uniref:Uncharacterized protein n=2 Tax=Myxococcus virescens TaxID=83456 RepID=A0A511HIT5_9BACT|nr:hypothetical protein MVI01_50880 [Myxococcus virescens]